MKFIDAGRVTDDSKRYVWFDSVGFVLILCNNSRLLRYYIDVFISISILWIVGLSGYDKHI